MYPSDISKTGMLKVTVRVDENGAEVFIVEGNRISSQERQSDVECFEENASDWIDDFFPEGVPEAGLPRLFEFVGYIKFEHSNTPDGEDWDAHFIVEEWREI